MQIILLKKLKSLFGPKKFLPQALKNLSAAVICVNSDLKVKFINEKCEKLLKYTNQEINDQKLEQLFKNNASYNEFVQQIHRLPKDEATIKSNELSIIDANNNKIPVTIALKKIWDSPKPLIGFILILTDISETKKYYKILEEKTQEIEQKNENLKKLQKELEIEKNSIEEKIKKRTDNLEKEHAKLLSSINNLSLCFLLTDKYNNIILSNKAARNMFPFINLEEKITVEELQKSAQIDIDLNIQIKKVMNEKKCINITDVQIDSKYINIFISPIVLNPQQNSDAMGVSIIIEDQTKQHDLERSKEDLFNIASHELRTPLTAIYGYTALIKQMYFGNIQIEELKMIINNIEILSKKLSLSVNNFLDSSKLEQGKIELKIDQYNLFTLINESIKEMEGMALWKNLYIKFDPPASPITITADRIRVTQVLNILISNAIKFTHIGGIYISVETKLKLSQPFDQASFDTHQSEPKSASGGLNFAKIIIKDTGTGISEESKKLLFQKFQRTGDNLLTREEGTGLGLHLAKLLIEKMGGEIMLEKTEINKGSAFSFTVPMFN